MKRGYALIVDDEADVAAYHGRILTDHGWRVHIALSGDEGLAVALEETPDVILLDLLMPGGRGGLNTFMELRRNLSLAFVPVVFVTAYPQPDPDDLHSFLGSQNRLRPDAYLEKPVEPDTLLSTLDEVASTTVPATDD